MFFFFFFHLNARNMLLLLLFLIHERSKLNFYGRELYSNNISGKIPEELGNLTNLVSLDLYMNNLSGPIPTTLGKLAKLRFLYEYTSFKHFLQSLNFLTF